ncbi:hypothetical protein JST97_27145 [bacterium]|nr:hypothetical protein [bacterium]
MRLEIQDGLAIGDHLNLADYRLLVYVRVPPTWLEGEDLVPSAKEAVLARMYGPNWRSGNQDGSFYVVLRCSCRAMSPSEEAAGGWRQTPHSWYYRVNSAGELEKEF